MANEIKVTNEGLKNLKDELNFLKEVKRNEVVEAIRLALSYGDLSENSEYDEAKTEQARVESRIQELEEILKNVQVIEDHEIKTDTVNIGAIVSVVNLNNGKEFEYTMVGVTESNPLKGKISDRSPIGKALMGRRTGDDVPVETPAGRITLKIVSIRKLGRHKGRDFVFTVSGADSAGRQLAQMRYATGDVTTSYILNLSASTKGIQKKL